MVLLALGLTLVALIQVLCLFALVDQYKGLLQIRDTLRLVDTAQELPLLGFDDVRPSSVGLPKAIDSEQVAVVLLLSTKCTTCKGVARGLGGRLPPTAWAVIEGRSEDECRAFQEEVGLTGERIQMDVGGKIAEGLKTRIFPTAFVFTRGAARIARTIPSYRQFRELLEVGGESYSVAS